MSTERTEKQRSQLNEDLYEAFMATIDRLTMRRSAITARIAQQRADLAERVVNDWLPAQVRRAAGDECQTWSLPLEPGPQVERLRDRYGDEWRRTPAGRGWVHVDEQKWRQKPLTWSELFEAHWPLSDATQETTHG